jgi:hypothetical protein
MSGTVSYELLNSKLGGGESGFTTEGGYYETFINNSGTSVKGTVVIASASVYNGVDIAPANSTFAIGVIYENDVPNGSKVKVVVSGKAQVLLKDQQSATLGYWCGVSDVQGRMYQRNTLQSQDEHNKEIGHSLQSATAGTNILSLIQVHLN